MDIESLNNGEAVVVDAETYLHYCATALRHNCFVRYWDSSGGIADFVAQVVGSARLVGFWTGDDGKHKAEWVTKVEVAE
jgi:hypothetical protein